MAGRGASLLPVVPGASVPPERELAAEGVVELVVAEAPPASVLVVFR